MHPGIPHRNNLTEALMMKESKTSRTNSSPVEAVGNQEPVIIFCNISALLFSACCNYNESHDTTKINEPVGVSLSKNLKSWDKEISTKSRHTIQLQEQTKPKQNKATIFEEQRAQAAIVPFNNIQSAVFSVPVCYLERSSKYLERRRGDETGKEQWDFGCVMASVQLALPALCSVCCVVSVSPFGPLLVLRPGGVSAPPSPHIFLSETHLLTNTRITFCFQAIHVQIKTCQMGLVDYFSAFSKLVLDRQSWIRIDDCNPNPTLTIKSFNTP